MTGRPWRQLVGFGAGLVVLLGAVGWISVTALRLERAEVAARQQAAVEESVRLALWRMDSDMMPILAREAARPAFNATDPPVELPERVLLHFQVRADGGLWSPQAELAPRLERLRALVTRGQLEATLRAPPAPAAPPQDYQQARNSVEWQARTKSVRQAATYANDDNAAVAPGTVTRRGFAAPDQPMVPAWVGGELFLVRRLAGPGGEAILQGAWLDWPALRDYLLVDVADLLPAARLQPAGASAGDDQRMLASLPVLLIPGTVAPVAAAPGVPVKTMLGVAWSGVLLAAAAVLALLLGALALSERRATFVSAVTHELRTPLTTLRTYSEMLDEGMITDAAKQKTYLKTMSREASRLAHLVENVLSYSRVERGHGGERTQVIAVADLLGRARGRLVERAEQARMELVVAEPPPGLAVRADPPAVEQILFNLVDNACKYARDAADKRIHLTAAPAGAQVALRVADHGPGVPAAERKKLFRPFARSAQQAAGSAPGVGLGLALCRRLARAMGGDLTIAGREPGMVMVLSLPSTTLSNGSAR